MLLCERLRNLKQIESQKQIREVNQIPPEHRNGPNGLSMMLLSENYLPNCVPRRLTSLLASLIYYNLIYDLDYTLTISEDKLWYDGFPERLEVTIGCSNLTSLLARLIDTEQ